VFSSSDGNERDLVGQLEWASLYHWGWSSSVGIVTDYGLNGLGNESQWGRAFLHTSRPALGPTHPSVQQVLGLSQG
jgi:hypothetical protein